MKYYFHSPFYLLFNAIKFSYTESEIVLDIKQSGQFLNVYVHVQDFGMGFDFLKKSCFLKSLPQWEELGPVMKHLQELDYICAIK
jgi:hypothetical protein